MIRMDLAHQKRMDKVYRQMKYIYDFTRPFFLAGRKRLRRAVRPMPGQRVLEVGCGTGRNLVVLAQEWPDSTFVGVDISSEMTAYARSQVERRRLGKSVRIFEGELRDFQSSELCDGDYDYIMFSYSLSMIENWQNVLREASTLLKPDTGKLLIADFGACEVWPRLIARRLYKNLSYFHVTPRPELFAFLSRDLGSGETRIKRQRLLGGYAQVLELTKPSPQQPHPA